MWRKGAGAALLVALLLCGGWFAAQLDRGKLPPSQPVAVSALPPKEVSLPATIEPVEITLVPAPVDGAVESFTADAGQEVAQGQLLGTIRSPALVSSRETAVSDAEHAQTRLNTLESNLIAARLEASRAEADSTRARSEFESAQRAYERQTLLDREGATPRLVFEKAGRDFQTAKSDLESLQTLFRQAQDRVLSLETDITAAKKSLDEKNKAAEGAQLQLSAAEIRSPVDGLILKRGAQQGDEVTRQTKDLFQIITNLSRLRVVAAAPVVGAARLHAGMPCSLRVAESPEPIACEIKQVQDGRVAAEFASPTAAIRPGLSAQLVIHFE